MSIESSQQTLSRPMWLVEGVIRTVSHGGQALPALVNSFQAVTSLGKDQATIDTAHRYWADAAKASSVLYYCLSKVLNPAFKLQTTKRDLQSPYPFDTALVPEDSLDHLSYGLSTTYLMKWSENQGDRLSYGLAFVATVVARVAEMAFGLFVATLSAFPFFGADTPCNTLAFRLIQIDLPLIVFFYGTKILNPKARFLLN